ncbi:hypothetical protein KSP39_PZI024243 [Platanthera zijinensis]|uniref:Uncharacterized protein n=1 Tax=Platanthera zijinensis TaxID=2320716 RepID=A0AAP0ASL7_9ASPA
MPAPNPDVAGGGLPGSHRQVRRPPANPPEVFAGAFLGVFLGVVWFWIVNNLFVDYFPGIEDSAVGRFLYIKDTSHIPNVLKFEYDNARAARQKTATD